MDVSYVHSWQNEERDRGIASLIGKRKSRQIKINRERERGYEATKKKSIMFGRL